MTCHVLIHNLEDALQLNGRIALAREWVSSVNSFYIQLNEEEGWLLLSNRSVAYVGPAVPMHLCRQAVLDDPWYFVRILNQFLDDGPWVEMRWADDAEYAWPYCVYCRSWVDRPHLNSRRHKFRILQPPETWTIHGLQ